jgi:hypothetical protein
MSTFHLGRSGHVDTRYNQGYTCTMKTAISIPDRLFNAAEEAARRLAVSRSELYARALEQFLAARREEEVTQRLNAVYSEVPAQIDPVLARMQFASLPADIW